MYNPSDLFKKERSDLSNFLIHLTKDGSFDEYKPFEKSPGSFLFGQSEKLNAEKSLLEILTFRPNPTILARSPFGHFKYNIDVGFQRRGGIPLDWLQCVCFSETPLRELKSFYSATQDPKNAGIKHNKYQKYGLAFSTELVRKKGGHPVFYFDSRRKDIVNALNAFLINGSLSLWKSLLPLFEQYGPRLHTKHSGNDIDFRWEREWRCVGDFKFTLDEVAFGLCPEAKIQEFNMLVKNKFPFIDPDWDQHTLQKKLIASEWSVLADAF